MSRSVDERIVQMKFDNTQFEKNVSKSMGTLDKLKSKLNSLSGKETSTALDNLAKSANSIDFSGLANNIQSISDRFSTMILLTACLALPREPGIMSLAP